jgi:hypothetical protein
MGLRSLFNILIGFGSSRLHPAIDCSSDSALIDCGPSIPTHVRKKRGSASASGGTTPNTAPSAPSTPVGTSTVQISATAGGNTVQSFALTLTVQN